MKRALAILAFVLGSVASALATGSFIGYIDGYTFGAWTILRPVRMTAWGFDCATGDTTSASLLLLDGVAVPVHFTFGDPRPDVAQAYTGACVTTPYAGFHADFYATGGWHYVQGYFGTPNGSYFIDQAFWVPKE